MNKTFNSNYEAHSIILEEIDILQDVANNLGKDFSFLWMNIKAGNFDDPEKQAHALKELSYLVRSATKTAETSKKIANLATLLHDQIAGIPLSEMAEEPEVEPYRHDNPM